MNKWKFPMELHKPILFRSSDRFFMLGFMALFAQSYKIIRTTVSSIVVDMMDNKRFSFIASKLVFLLTTFLTRILSVFLVNSHSSSPVIIIRPYLAWKFFLSVFSSFRAFIGTLKTAILTSAKIKFVPRIPKLLRTQFALKKIVPSTFSASRFSSNNNSFRDYFHINYFNTKGGTYED